MDDLNKLNPQQRQAVTAAPGPVLVLAGPGSGKTRVLTYRIGYLIESLGVRPHRILSVTFTNKAAREMTARVEKLIGQSPQGLWMGTFHSVCARILRREAKHLPFDSNFAIFDTDDQTSIVKRVFKELNLSDKSYKPSSILAAISEAKNNLKGPEEYLPGNYREEIVQRVYQRYDALLRASNALDFDDLLLWTWRLLDTNKLVRESYSYLFEYILVDEFQDTNMVQYELLRHLASRSSNIFVVGDEDQSIYRWRGADYRNVLRFEEDYPGAQKILLEQNYRSTQLVLDVAQAVINRNRHRTPKNLRSTPELGQGDKIVLYEASDDHAEAAWVVDTIQKLSRTGAARPGDFAVMYRTNAQSRLVEEAFLHAGIAYRLVGAQRFYGRREVKDLIAYLRLVSNPADEISLARVINTPTRGIGEKTVATLQMTAQVAGVSAGAVLLALAQEGEKSPYYEALGRPARQLADFGGRLRLWRDALETQPLPEVFTRILDDIGYREYVDDGTEEGESRWENVQELLRLTYEYEDRGLAAFLETLALVSDQDTIPEQAEAPTLLTLHASKGLEFDRVFITGLDDGMLPHSRSLDDPEEMSEERRLFYVGITRARKQVYLTRAEQRSTYGSFQTSIPSRFLEDIPKDMLVNQSSNLGRRESSRAGGLGRDAESFGWGSANRKDRDAELRALRTSTHTPPPQAAAPVLEPKFKAGARVNHPTWGEGLVLESRVRDGEETVTVHFESVGLKRVDPTLAKLEPKS